VRGARGEITLREKTPRGDDLGNITKKHRGHILWAEKFDRQRGDWRRENEPRLLIGTLRRVGRAEGKVSWVTSEKKKREDTWGGCAILLNLTRGDNKESFAVSSTGALSGNQVVTGDRGTEGQVPRRGEKILWEALQGKKIRKKSEAFDGLWKAETNCLVLSRAGEGIRVPKERGK